MKVLILSHMFPRSCEDWGGIFVHEQVRALRSAGVDARVAVGNPRWVEWKMRMSLGVVPWRTLKTLAAHMTPSGAPPWVDLRGVPTFYFEYIMPPLRLWGALGARSYTFGQRRRLNALRRDFPFDVVHAHTAFLDGTAASMVADWAGVPLVLTEHTGPFTAITSEPKMRHFTERAINRADIIISVSNKLRSDILREVRVREPDRIRVIGNGFDPSTFYPGSDGPPQDGTIRALWVGGYMPVKQPLMLVEAFAAAKARNSTLHMSMVGNGVLEEQVRARVAELGLETAVEFYPSSTRDQVAGLMRRHHFLVVSSETETFGLVAVGAMGCGRPVLTTRCGGPEETVGDDTRGELVDNNKDALKRGFLRMAGRLSGFRADALASYARERFGFDRIAAQVSAVYNSVAGNEKITD